MSSFQDGQVDIDNTPLPVTGTITVTPSGTQDVRVVADTDGLAKDSTVAALTKPSDTQLVDGSAHTQPVSGTVTTIPSGTQNVDVTNFPATQPVSISGTVNVDVTNTVPVTLTSTTITGNVTVIQPTGSSLHVDVDNFPSTQPVSGTVIADIKDSSGNPLNSNGAGALKVDASATTQPISGSVSVSNFPVTQPISGIVTVQQPAGSALHADIDNFPATQTVTGTVGVSGSVTVAQPTGTNLHVVVDSAPSTPVTGTVAVSNFPATQPVTEINLDKNFGTWSYYAGVSGTVTVTAGQRVIGISAHSTTGGSMTINGGATITIPANVSFNLAPLGNVTAPTIVFTSTDTYFVEAVS